MSRITNDVPPYTVGGGIPYCLGGINRIGLKRRQFSFEVRKALAQAFRLVYRSHLPLNIALNRIEKEIEQSAEIRHFVDFCRTSKRGLIGMQGIRQVPLEKEDSESLDEKIPDLLLEMATRGG
jgi:UDP-N-acetylglucosamine acyltransferase